MELLLTGISLLTPVALVTGHWRHVFYVLVAVLLVQALVLGLAGCITSVFQCSSFCAFAYPVCEGLSDSKDMAPFGLAIFGLVSLAATFSVLLIRLAVRQARSKLSNPCAVARHWR